MIQPPTTQPDPRWRTAAWYRFLDWHTEADRVVEAIREDERRGIPTHPSNLFPLSNQR